MTEAELNAIIQAAGGGCWALDYAGALLEKITRVEAVGGYESLSRQLRSAKEPGDFRGRVLEVNFANLFVENCDPAFQRPSVIGVFEPADKALTAEQADWAEFNSC